MKNNKLVIVSSNIKKIKEYNNFGLSIKAEKGVDLPEVDGDINEIITHKALSVGINKVAEDTILEVDGKHIVDIKWKIKEMNKDASAKWIVSLGVNDGKTIKIYRGIINGDLIKSESDNILDFDPYFIPKNSELTLSQLDKIGEKNNFSARKIACENLINNNTELVINITDILKWTGNYQNS